MLISKNKLFIGKSKVGLNLSWQHNHRNLFTDENKEVNMKLDVLGMDLKTWLPSKANTEFIIGLQGSHQQNNDLGEHAMVLPDYLQNDFALIGLLKHKHKSNINVQAGVRMEYRSIYIPQQLRPEAGHEHKKTAEASNLIEELDRNYSNLSVSLGATWNIAEDLLLRINGASAYRTPNVAELTQEGVHGSRYELGNRDLLSQRSYEGDMSLHYHTQRAEMDIAGFYNHINRYIFLAPTANYAEELQIYQYNQADANIYGTEVFFGVSPQKWMNINATLSYLRGKQSPNGYLPFIPQDKIKLEVKLKKDELIFMKQLYFALGTTLAFEQNRPSEFESPTAFYSLLNMHLGFTASVSKQKFYVTLMGTNLLDELYIDHLSTLKDMRLYNMGRNVSLQIKIPFGASLADGK